ncbi:MAG: hypothetical protein K0S11_100 [Gammaproteobacteria bacterium]|jgi:hypothetical protein|nr:hypothetical protein [Gammaproteobacteria bacterium]
MQPDTAIKMIRKLLTVGEYSLTELAKKLQVEPSLIKQLYNGGHLSSVMEQRLIRLYCKTNFTKSSVEY